MFCLNEEDEDEEKDDPSLFDSGKICLFERQPGHVLRTLPSCF